MAIATMTSKGQVTIPKEVRDELGLETGTKLWFVRTPQGYVLRAASSSLMRLSGILEGEVPRLTAAEIERRLAEGLAEKFAPAPLEDAAG
jgi:AbrB family looped-hinge helix DNA binding protein